jgi:Flp pilus assembly protein TadG
MKALFNISAKLRSEKGVTLVYVAILLVVFLGMTALAVDIGYLMVSRNELQNAADASALAATRKLGSIYQAMSYDDQQSYVCNPNDIIPVAQLTAASNMAATQFVTVPDADVVIGTWDTTTKVLSPTLNQPDAVGVTTRRDDTPGVGGRVGTFFAQIFNIQSLPVTATAVAALTGQGTSEPGELQLPVGVSRSKFTGQPNSWCGQVIKFSPTTDPDACAGWTTFTSQPANNQQVKKIVDGLEESPFVYVGDSDFYYINGNLSEGTFESLLTQYKNLGHDVDKIYNPAEAAVSGYVYPTTLPSGVNGVPLCENANGAGACGPGGIPLRYPPCSGQSGCSGPLRYSHEWETTVVVYDSDNCTPGGGTPIPVAGFASVVVYNVGSPANKVIEARVRCDYVTPESTRGGGGNFGKKGSIPGLVK